jgi:hypothetical protein
MVRVLNLVNLTTIGKDEMSELSTSNVNRKGGHFFELREEHLKLLQRANIQWNEGELSAPGLDTKRPFGNSDHYRDIAHILEFKPKDGDEFSAKQIEAMESLYGQLDLALEVVLRLRTFVPGLYESDKHMQDIWLVNPSTNYRPVQLIDGEFEF